LSLIAVFIPVLLMEGIVGRLFREFAVTVTAAVLVSGFVSLTFVPMMCAKFLHHHVLPDANTWRGRLDRLLERFFVSIEKIYERALRVVLHHQRLTLFSLILTFGLTIFVFIKMPKGFFPLQDIGLIEVTAEASADVSYDAMME